MTPELFKAVSLNLEKHEGRKLEMYRDTKGIVTCGIGHALFAAVDAYRPGMVWYKDSHVFATVDEVKAKWAAVRQNVRCFSLMMTYEQSDMLLENDLIKFERIIRATFPEVDSYPHSAQVALYDLAFNTGSVTTNNWPHLTMAVLKRDWVIAANECHRPAVSKSRNDETVAQFLAGVNAS